MIGRKHDGGKTRLVELDDNRQTILSDINRKKTDTTRKAINKVKAIGERGDREWKVWLSIYIKQ
jgi:hypothetical protein